MLHGEGGSLWRSHPALTNTALSRALQSERSAARMRILVVEDDAATRDLLQRSLEEAGHAVVAAAGYEDGLRLGLGEPCALAILDVMLPDGSRLDLCRALRARRLRLPIL